MLLHGMAAILPVEGTHWLIAIFVYLEWLSAPGSNMWRMPESIKSIHTPRGLPWGHTSYLRLREDCLTVSLPTIFFWKVPSTPLSLGSASLGSQLAQAGWWAAVLGLDGRGWEPVNLLPLSNRLCRQRASKLVPGENHQMQDCSSISPPGSCGLP